MTEGEERKRQAQRHREGTFQDRNGNGLREFGQGDLRKISLGMATDAGNLEAGRQLRPTSRGV